MRSIIVYIACLLAVSRPEYEIPVKQFDLAAHQIRPECFFEVTSFDTDMISRTLMATYHS